MTETKNVSIVGEDITFATKNVENRWWDFNLERPCRPRLNLELRSQSCDFELRSSIIGAYFNYSHFYCKACPRVGVY